MALTPGRKKLISYAAMIIVGVSFFMYAKTLLFYITAEQTQGRILKVNKRWMCHQDANSNQESCNWYYSPTYTFTDRQEHTRTISSNISTTSSNTYFQGQPVAVLYKPSNSGIARINNFPDLWFYAFFSSLVAIIIALVYLIWSRKEKDDHDANPPWIRKIVTAGLFMPLLVIITSYFS